MLILFLRFWSWPIGRLSRVCCVAGVLFSIINLMTSLLDSIRLFDRSFIAYLKPLWLEDIITPLAGFAAFLLLYIYRANYSHISIPPVNDSTNRDQLK